MNFEIESITPLNDQLQKDVVSEIIKVSENHLYKTDSNYFYSNDVATAAIKNLVLNFEIQTYESNDEIVIQCPEKAGEPFYFKSMYLLKNFPEVFNKDNDNVLDMNYEEGVFIVSALFLKPYNNTIILDQRGDPLKVYLWYKEKLKRSITITW